MNYPNQQAFAAKQQDSFEIQFTADKNVTCRIEEITVSQVPSASHDGQQFSVVFVHESPQVFEQGVYPVSHPELGKFDLFLVPVFGDDKCVQYEAVFT